MVLHCAWASPGGVEALLFRCLHRAEPLVYKRVQLWRRTRMHYVLCLLNISGDSLVFLFSLSISLG